jgi:ABC-type Fe3+/spermidine/putrescine transport system ATPase subunit
VGMVFQSYALWPHMDVAGNVGYGLRVRRMPAAERAARVAEALETVGLGGFEGAGCRASRAGSASAWRSRAAWPCGRGCCCFWLRG